MIEIGKKSSDRIARNHNDLDRTVKISYPVRYDGQAIVARRFFVRDDVIGRLRHQAFIKFEAFLIVFDEEISLARRAEIFSRIQPVK